MIEFKESHVGELSDLIRYDNALLFLGQNYQMALGGKNYFAEEINKRVCGKKFSNPTYSNLWEKMSETSTSNRKEGGHPILDEAQKNRMAEIGAEIPQNSKLSEVLNLGWASVVTSAIDPGIINAEGVDCNPIYTASTRPAGMANKRRLHVTYLFGCIAEEHSYPTSYKVRGSARTDAELMYTRLLKEAIQYSGALVIDGWNPNEDWASVDFILGNGLLDADMPFPKIYVFNCTQEVKAKLFDSERAEELIESDKLVVSESGFYDCFETFISNVSLEKRQEQAAFETSETVSFQRGKNTITLNIPREQLRILDPERVHLLTPRDRMQVAFDQDGIKNLTVRFLSNSQNSFPLWQGYLHDCCFEREVYKNDQKTGLYDRAMAILQAPNLHKVNSTIILHGPSNSGKTVLLGKLALELSRNYPVIFINGELEVDDPEITRYRYQNMISFINTYLTRNPQLPGRIRAVVIWDNDAFVDKLQNYLEFARGLAESNAILIGSAYEIRDVEGYERKPRRGVEYIQISSELNTTIEFLGMEKMLSQNLGPEFTNAFSRIRKNYVPQRSGQNIISDESRILSLLQRTFRIVGTDMSSIVDEAVGRADREAVGTEELMLNRFEYYIEKASNNYNTDINGLAEILAQCTDENDKDEEWYRQLEQCAPTLNDILAVAGQFGIRLPLNLVKEVICDPEICPDIKYYMDAVDDILAFDTMLEYPFPIDQVGHVLVGYRSPDEAEIYLNSHYTRRGNVSIDIPYDNEKKSFLEDREIYLLEKLIEHSNLEDYSDSNWHTVTTVRELLDQFGTNSRKGETFARQYEYKYDELASFILRHGGSENPEMALSAAFLKREQIRTSMLNSIRFNYNIKNEELSILNDAADGLEHAIEIEERENNVDTQRMMRIYVEWCTNRNYVLNREKPGIQDLDMFRQIHIRFSKALSIYLRQDIHRMKPMNMMDVYLNGFNYYVMAMEKLYHVESDPEHCDPIKLSEYTEEITYAMDTVLGKLLDFDDVSDSRDNLNRNILSVYQLSQKSIRALEAKTRAHGSTAYILLKARNMWIKDNDAIDKNDIQQVQSADLYLLSDFAEAPGKTPTEMVRCAERVYTYLTSSDNLNVLLSKRTRGDKEISGLEMLIRATWISKTGNMPFTLNQFPKLLKSDWEELHKYCKAYVESGNDRARYAFAFYLEGIYYWTFTPDSWSSISRLTPSKEKFDACVKVCHRPQGVYSSDSFMFLCELGTGKPIKFNARVQKKTDYRDEADISSAVDQNMISELPYIINRKKIFCAQSLQRRAQRNSIESRVITIRFNLQGALAGPEKPETEVVPYGKE